MGGGPVVVSQQASGGKRMQGTQPGDDATFHVDKKQRSASNAPTNAEEGAVVS
jgi:hypothetical protein